MGVDADLETGMTTRMYKLERRCQVAEGLRDVLVMLNSNRPQSDILSYLLKQACALFSADGGGLYRVEQTSAQSFIEAQIGQPPGEPQDKQPLSFNILDLWYHQNASPDTPPRNNAPIFIPHLSNLLANTGARRKPLSAAHIWLEARANQYRSALVLPLIAEGETYGGLVCFYCEKPQLKEEDQQLSAVFAYQAALVIENIWLRAQAEKVAVLQERNRLARDLHDSVSQSLYSLTVLAEAGRRLAKAGDLPRVSEVIVRLGEIGQQALKEMRLLLYQLRPAALKNVGLVRAVQQRLDTVEKRAGVQAQLRVEGKRRLPSKIEEDLYHIIQEALNNTLKHAEADEIIVRIQQRPGTIKVSVVDNGSGFIPSSTAAQGGLGLLNMRERAEKLGGTLKIESAPGMGTQIRVQLPRASKKRREENKR